MHSQSKHQITEGYAFTKMKSESNQQTSYLDKDGSKPLMTKLGTTVPR
jgi:hypothetical protein